MAKTNTKHNNHQSFLANPFVIGLIAIACIGLISGVIILLFSDGEPESVENDRKPSSIEASGSQTSDKQESIKPEVVQYEGENVNDLDELTGQIRYMQQADSFLVVSVMINQYLSESGVCTMTLTGRNAGKVYTVTSTAEADVTTSSCGQLKLSLQNVTSDNYDVEIKIEGDGKKGVIKQEGVEI